MLLCAAVLFVRGQQQSPSAHAPTDSLNDQPTFKLTGRLVGVGEAVQPGFGTTLATAGNWTATGDPLGYSRMGRTGCVFLVNKRQLEEQTAVPIVLGPENQYSRTFGYTLAMDETHLVVGAPLELTPNKQVGAAYVYDLDDDGYTFAQRLVAPKIIPNARFGFSIAIKDDTIVIGSPENEITTGHV